MAEEICSSCRFYDPFRDAPHIGMCLNHPDRSSGLRAQTVSGRTAAASTLYGFSPIVTNCSSCTEWNRAREWE